MMNDCWILVRGIGIGIQVGWTVSNYYYIITTLDWTDWATEYSPSHRHRTGVSRSEYHQFLGLLSVLTELNPE